MNLYYLRGSNGQDNLAWAFMAKNRLKIQPAEWFQVECWLENRLSSFSQCRERPILVLADEDNFNMLSFLVGKDFGDEKKLTAFLEAVATEKKREQLLAKEVKP